jgi:K+-sensing histidine kinase KdpD
MNLATNATKFALGSEVRVRVLMEPQQDDPAAAQPAGTWLRVDVADSGAGLTPEECERIFKPWERAPPEKVRRTAPMLLRKLCAPPPPLILFSLRVCRPRCRAAGLAWGCT